MDTNEIFEHVTRGIAVLIGGISGGWIGIALPYILSQRIRSQEELERVVKKESHKLSLDYTKIDVEYEGITDGARKNGDRYDLHLVGDWLSTRATVRHELYHILKDCDKPISLPYYLFIAEPRALLYGAFKIKL